MGVELSLALCKASALAIVAYSGPSLNYLKLALDSLFIDWSKHSCLSRASKEREGVRKGRVLKKSASGSGRGKKVVKVDLLAEAPNNF